MQLNVHQQWQYMHGATASNGMAPLCRLICIAGVLLRSRRQPRGGQPPCRCSAPLDAHLATPPAHGHKGAACEQQEDARRQHTPQPAWSEAGRGAGSHGDECVMAACVQAKPRQHVCRPSLDSKALALSCASKCSLCLQSGVGAAASSLCCGL